MQSFLHQVDQDPLQSNDLTRHQRQRLEQLYRQLVQRENQRATPPVERLTPERLQKIRLSAGQGYW